MLIFSETSWIQLRVLKKLQVAKIHPLQTQAGRSTVHGIMVLGLLSFFFFFWMKFCHFQHFLVVFILSIDIKIENLRP